MIKCLIIRSAYSVLFVAPLRKSSLQILHPASCYQFELSSSRQVGIWEASPTQPPASHTIVLLNHPSSPRNIVLRFSSVYVCQLAISHTSSGYVGHQCLLCINKTPLKSTLTLLKPISAIGI